MAAWTSSTPSQRGACRPALLARLVCLSRNFGSFAAIRTRLARAGGNAYFAVVCDPPELAARFYGTRSKQDRADVVVGTRAGRDDPLMSRPAFGRALAALPALRADRNPSPAAPTISPATSAQARRPARAGRKCAPRWSDCCSGWASVAPSSSIAAGRAGNGRSGWSFRRRFQHSSMAIFAFSGPADRAADADRRARRAGIGGGSRRWCSAPGRGLDHRAGLATPIVLSDQFLRRAQPSSASAWSAPAFRRTLRELEGDGRIRSSCSEEFFGPAP